MPYDNDTSPVGSKPNGSHWTAPKDFDISCFTDGTSRLSTDPALTQARQSEGVFTIKELFEGTGCKHADPFWPADVRHICPGYVHCMTHVTCPAFLV